MPHKGGHPLTGPERRGAETLDSEVQKQQRTPVVARTSKAAATCRRPATLIVISLLACALALSIVHLASGQKHLTQSNEVQQQQQQQQHQQQQQPQQSNSSSIEHQKHSQQQAHQHNQQPHKLRRNQKQTADHLLFPGHQHVGAQMSGVGAGAANALGGEPLKHPLHDSERHDASLSSSLLRAYIRTNNMRAYHLDLHAYREEAKYAGDPAFVDSQSAEHVQRCRRHLAHYEALLSAFRQTDPMETTSSLDSLRLADTYGRPGAGLLDGHQFWLGSYERCLDLRDVRVPSSGDAPTITQSEPANSQYCLGLAQFPSWNPKDTKTSIKIGMCLPETCTSSMLNEQGELFERAERMMRVHLGDVLPFNKLRLRSVYCLPHETSPVRQYSLSAKLLLTVMSTFVVACLYATISDYLNTKTTATPSIKLVPAATGARTAAANAGPARQDDHDDHDDHDHDDHDHDDHDDRAAAGRAEHRATVKLVLASEERTWRNVFVKSFSLIRNFEKITTIRRPASVRVEPVAERLGGEAPNATQGAIFDRDMFFRCITGLKCIGLLWIIAAHTFLVGPITSSNLISMDRLTKTYLANVYLTAHLLVDTFFALSGLLASYLIFSKGIHKFKLSHWIVMTVHRYWRLTPVYLICYWFAKSMGHLVSSGPLWDYMTAAHSPRLNCANESWLEAVLHRSDFKSPKSHCVPFAWFIANGIKFWIVTPVFLVAIYKSVRRGYALVCATILANIAIVFALAINSPVDMKSVIEFKPESADNMLNEMEDIYTRPYSRIGAYLVGLLAGHCFYAWELGGQRVNLSEKTKIAVWSLVSVTMIVLAFVVKIADGIELEEAAIPWVFSFCSAIIRPLWALCTCWLVFALSHGQARWLAKFVGARAWLVLAKLSFSAYLVQGEVIANLYLAQSHSNPFYYSDMVTLPLVASVATILAAFLMAIFVEYPLIGIEELILPVKALKDSIRDTKSEKTSADPGAKMTDDLSDKRRQQQQTCDAINVQRPYSQPLKVEANKLKEL